MTDTEIIRALECCTTKGAKCSDCPAFKKVDRSECKKYFRGAIDLISRQKSEIERLQSMNRAKLDTIHDLQADTNKLKEQLQDVTEKFNCQQTVYADLSKIIKGQKAEIDRLKNENDILSKNADTAFQDGLNEAQDLYAEQVKDEIKLEAIKEFTERLKNIYIKDKRYDRPNAHTLIDWLFANIDNLVKEMVGDE